MAYVMIIVAHTTIGDCFWETPPIGLFSVRLLKSLTKELTSLFSSPLNLPTDQLYWMWNQSCPFIWASSCYGVICKPLGMYSIHIF